MMFVLDKREKDKMEKKKEFRCILEYCLSVIVKK